MPVSALLFDGPLSCGQRSQAVVWDRLAAIDRQPVSPCFESRLGALEGGKIVVESLPTALVELVLIEVLKALVASFPPIRSLQRTLAVESRDRVLDSCPFAW